MLAELHDTVRGRLSDDRQRYTGSRRAIIEVLARAERPLTIPEILADDSGLAQSSAYRNLAVLEQAGVVHRIVTADEFARYELDEDLTGHHHHLICSGCGTVVDFTAPTQLERSLQTVIARVEDDTGFRAEHHRLDLVGVCAECA